MSPSHRAPAPPPSLEGFTYEGLLGTGGFADVFLYAQRFPQRRVAVKVLLTERLSQGTADAFEAEANIMARLSSHPAIVTIYQAGVSDDGRPYLVMEYCSRPNLQMRARREPLSIPEALRVGVQISGAVETAHRAGILHRDIKPANILVTEYNSPVLTDFGISVVQGGAGESSGLSIPWSPPEMFADESAGDATADVYSLAATVYNLLTARSPFEVPGQRNSTADLIQRIETDPVAPMGRPDVPESLRRALERGMSKRPADRYATALDFARALQKVQSEMNLNPTAVDLLDDTIRPGREETEDEGLTRRRGPVLIDPSAPPVPTGTGTIRRTPLPSADTVSRDNAPVVSGIPVLSPGSRDETVRRAPVLEAQEAPREIVIGPPPTGGSLPGAGAAEHSAEARSVPRPRRRLTPWLVGAAAVVVVGGGIAWATLALTPPETTPREPPGTSVPQDPLSPAQVSDLEGSQKDGEVVFTWVNPDPRDGDTYQWTIQRLGEEGQARSVSEPTVTVEPEPSGPTCIEVYLVRSNGVAGPPAQACAS